MQNGLLFTSLDKKKRWAVKTSFSSQISLYLKMSKKAEQNSFAFIVIQIVLLI